MFKGMCRVQALHQEMPSKADLWCLCAFTVPTQFTVDADAAVTEWVELHTRHWQNCQAHGDHQSMLWGSITSSSNLLAPHPVQI